MLFIQKFPLNLYLYYIPYKKEEVHTDGIRKPVKQPYFYHLY